MDLPLLRGLVFGRHGRVFKERDIQMYLESLSWYKPDPKFSNSVLNETERKNLDLIREAEAKDHDQVQLGDLRFWQTRVIPEDKLGRHSQSEWHVLAAEAEAVHGKRFDNEPWLQHYFDDRYWYHPSDHYEPGSLSTIERQNLQKILEAYRKQRDVALSPGDMQLYQDKPITEAMLKGLTLYELRLLRNEVYARRGKIFHTQWLKDYFSFEEWYTPEVETPELSEVERGNIAVITKKEKQIHESLSNSVISEDVLQGMFLEDARKLRNEVYARHGRSFVDPWLQSYFSGFDWYKPNPTFKDTDLNKIEQKNVQAILAYEQTALREIDAFEG